MSASVSRWRWPFCSTELISLSTIVAPVAQPAQVVVFAFEMMNWNE